MEMTLLATGLNLALVNLWETAGLHFIHALRLWEPELKDGSQFICRENVRAKTMFRLRYEYYQLTAFSQIYSEK